MAGQLSDQILQAINESSTLYNRLILVAGPPRSGKTSVLQDIVKLAHFPLVNLALELSHRLMELTKRQRVLQVSTILGDVIAAHRSDVVLLDNIELLFDVSLRQDPLRLLQHLARVRTVVAAWNGHLEGGDLIYAAPGHPEFRAYPIAGLLVVHAQASE